MAAWNEGVAAKPVSNSLGVNIVPTPLDQWRMLPDERLLPEKERIERLRLNALCSLYFFCRTLLGRDRFTEHLHLPICRMLHRVHLKEVLEIPRGHFKSTICTEGFPMWRTLRVRQQDAERILRMKGVDGRYLYGDEFVRHLLAIHNPDHCWLIAAEALDLARTLSGRIKKHYESNRLFRYIFDDMLPYECVTEANRAGRYHGRWSATAFAVNRDARGRGEATFECIGVGGALQSRHYDGGIIQDDLVGKKAIDSEIEMTKTIEWHRLLSGVFEQQDRNHEGNEIVVGNRWSYVDLNYDIRQHEPWFNFTTLSAVIGGGLYCIHERSNTCESPRLNKETGFCRNCKRYHDTECMDCGAKILFPEQFSFRKLAQIRRKQGSYYYSCQYLNNPLPPEDANFRPEWLCYFDLYLDQTKGPMIRHLNEFSGLRDRAAWSLNRYMIVDPNHQGAGGGARHAITVTGVADDGRKYLLECWAEACSHDKLITKMFEMARRWRLSRGWCEAIAAQKFLIYHVNQKAEKERFAFRLEPIEGWAESIVGGMTNRKEGRITALSPVFERREFFIQVHEGKFLEEYTRFPKGTYVDILDTLGYGPMIWKTPPSVADMMAAQRAQRLASMGRNPRTGY